MSKLTVFAISSLEHWYISFIFKSDQVQIVDLLRWVRKALNVRTWMSPWPGRTAMALGPSGSFSLEQTKFIEEIWPWSWMARARGRGGEGGVLRNKGKQLQRLVSGLGWARLGLQYCVRLDSWLRRPLRKVNSRKLLSVLVVCCC